MIHIRVDDDDVNSKAMMACGLGPGLDKLPKGDRYYFEAECSNPFRYNKVDCPGCAPAGPVQIGTPLSQLSGRPGEPGYAEFCRIARSWGYD